MKVARGICIGIAGTYGLLAAIAMWRAEGWHDVVGLVLLGLILVALVGLAFAFGLLLDRND